MHTKNLKVLGYTQLRGLFGDTELTPVRDRLAEVAEEMEGTEYPEFSNLRSDENIVFNLQNKDKLFVDLLGDPAIEKLLKAFINDPYYPALPEDAPNYILGEYVARVSGTSRLRLHIDSWMPAPGPRTWVMQVAIALNDRDETDGCTVAVPGSHVRGEYTEREFPETTALPVLAGDVIVWDGRLWHGSAPRTSHQEAWMLIATLQRWWVKPRFDMTRSLPREIYEQLTERQRALMGYASVPPATETEHTNTRRGYNAIEDHRKALFR